MNYQLKLKTFETDRLILTAVTYEDMYFIFNNFSKPEIQKILGHRSDIDFLNEEKKHKNNYSSYNRRFVMFLITEKESKKIIGRCGLHNWNNEHKRAEIGYVIEDETFKRKSYMSETVESVISYGFNQLNLNRIEAIVGVNNIPSIKILEKFNFRKEGVLTQHMLVDDVFVDSMIYAILRIEYGKT